MSKTYSNHRSEPYFTFLKNGQKTIEGRVKKGQYSLIQPGDYILVQNEAETESLKVLVKGLRSYSSFQELLTSEPLHKVLPDVDTVAQGVAVYERFYTLAQQQEFGVVAIEVELI